MISLSQFLIEIFKYLFGTFCVHMTARQREDGYHTPPNHAFLTSALCKIFASCKLLCTVISTICGPRDKKNLENWDQQIGVSLPPVENDDAERGQLVYAHLNGWSYVREDCLQTSVLQCESPSPPPRSQHHLAEPWWVPDHRVKANGALATCNTDLTWATLQIGKHIKTKFNLPRSNKKVFMFTMAFVDVGMWEMFSTQPTTDLFLKYIQNCKKMTHNALFKIGK